jgi:hypothetical protein
MGSGYRCPHEAPGLYGAYQAEGNLREITCLCCEAEGNLRNMHVFQVLKCLCMQSMMMLWYMFEAYGELQVGNIYVACFEGYVFDVMVHA